MEVFVQDANKDEVEDLPRDVRHTGLLLLYLSHQADSMSRQARGQPGSRRSPEENDEDLFRCTVSAMNQCWVLESGGRRGGEDEKGGA